MAGLAIGAVALLYALLPFSATGSDVLMMQRTVSCGPAVVEATRTPPPADGGWYGYAPLTSAPAPFDGRFCYSPARHRLTISAVGLFAAALLGLLTGRVDRSGDARRRTRWRPRPA